MKPLTYKEFAAKAGITTGNLSNYIARGNVVASEDKMIDADFGKNADFLRKRAKKQAKKAAKVPVKPPKKAAKVAEKPASEAPEPKKRGPKPKTKEAAAPVVVVKKTAESAKKVPAAVQKEPEKPAEMAPLVSEEAKAAYKIELEKEQLELEKLREQNRYAKIKADKAEGMVVPTDPVRMMVATHFKSLDLEYRDVLENLLAELAAELKITPQRVVKIREGVVKSLNKAKERAIGRTKRELANIVKEYSDTKGAGERE